MPIKKPDPNATVTRYGAEWPPGSGPEWELKIQMACIKRGGKWIGAKGKECGRGLFYHYKRFQEICWPDDYHHRWSDLQLKTILDSTITVVTGPKDSGKTRVCLTKFGLTDYYNFPDETLIIISSTTLAALEGRVWGDVKGMHQRAKDRFDFLPGHVLESKHAIVTDDLTDDAIIARDMRKGILCVPCKNSSGQFTGISSYVGMKQKRRRHLGDEFQFMSPAMMDSIANMNSGDYKGVFTGNPIGQDDPLDRMSEPECGWEANPEPTTTTVWKNKRFHNSYTITLFGTDSPTYDTPDGAEKYPGLLNDDSIQRVVAGYGKDSHQYYSQCLGIRKSGLNARRVLTKDLCRQFGAFDQAVWDGSKPVTKICAVDAAYGGAGGDRCVGGHIEFGLTIGQKIGIKVYPPQIIPISIKEGGSPEDKISGWVRTYCESHQIPPENFFYDSTGRGSLGPSLARTWSVQINPVEFGGGPTDRPVSMDIFTLDQKTGRKRLKTCKEHYSKFVTELWWTVRYAIESGQIREFPMDVCDEFCGREWKEVAGGRIEIETKSEMKKRTGQSPDLADWFVTALEGARRRGFAISKLASHESSGENLDWLRKLRDDAAKLNRDRQLTF